MDDMDEMKQAISSTSVMPPPSPPPLIFFPCHSLVLYRQIGNHQHTLFGSGGERRMQRRRKGGGGGVGMSREGGGRQKRQVSLDLGTTDITETSLPRICILCY